MTARRPRDKERTRQQVLTTARELFSQQGFHGTSLRDIEARSGVSKGLILHHFQNKQRLYAAVQEQLALEYIAMLASLRQPGRDLRETIKAVIRGSYRHTRENLDHRRVALWSYLEGIERSSDLEKRFTTALAEAMRAGQKAGIVRGDIDPLLMPFIIRGSIEYFIQKEDLLRDLKDVGEGGGSTLEQELVESLSTLFLLR